MLKALERFKMTLAYYLERRDIKYKFNKVLEKNKRKKRKWLKALKKYGMLILAEDSLGWQNRLIDKASVQFRLTAKNLGAHKGSFFMLLKMVN